MYQLKFDNWMWYMCRVAALERDLGLLCRDVCQVVHMRRQRKADPECRVNVRHPPAIRKVFVLLQKTVVIGSLNDFFQFHCSTR